MIGSDLIPGEIVKLRDYNSLIEAYIFGGYDDIPGGLAAGDAERYIVKKASVDSGRRVLCVGRMDGEEYAFKLEDIIRV